MFESRWFTLVGLTAAVIVGTAGETHAQPAVPGRPMGRPTVSPYINLLRNGNSAAFNYFGLVRPEQNALRAFQGLQQGVSNNQDTINTYLGNGQLGATGMPTQFMNYNTFFMNSGTAGQGPGGQGVNTGLAGRSSLSSGTRTNSRTATPRR